MSPFPPLQLRCLVWGILFYVQSGSSISEQKEEPMGRRRRQEMESHPISGPGSPLMCGVPGLRQPDGGWGQTSHCEVWSCQLRPAVRKPSPSPFFLTEVLKLISPKAPELGLIPAITNYHKFCDLKQHTFNILRC